MIKGFIEITDENDKKYLFSVNNIVSVCENLILFRNNNLSYDYALCKETYEEIKQKIKEAVG